MHKQLLAIFLVAAWSAAGLAEDEALSGMIKIDLSEIVATGVVEPVDGITSAGQPDEVALKVFAKNGYRTVIDLRTAGENRGLDEAAVVAELGMHYVNLAIAGGQAISFSNAQALDEAIENAEGPVLIHCGSANRVGALLALRKSLEGADDETALEYGRQSGMTGLQQRVEDILTDK